MAQISRQKKTRRDYHHGDLRNALLASARSLLERDGPVALSLRAVARAAGVSQAAPYHHFPDKEHLWAALATLAFNDLRACQIAAAESSGPHMRLSALGHAYVRFASQNPNMYRLMFGEAITDWRKYPEAARAKRRCFEPAQAVIASDPIGCAFSQLRGRMVNGAASRRIFLIIADRHGSSLDPSTRRDQLFAVSLSHAIALHACTGSVTLHPELLQLRVGSEADCYERVRIFAENGALVASMSLSGDGRVRWMDALRPRAGG